MLLAGAGAGMVRHEQFNQGFTRSHNSRRIGLHHHAGFRFAQAGGGIVLADLSQAFRVPVPPVHAARPISEILLVLAILLFPIDVALRRLIFRLEDLPAWRTAMKQAPAPAVPAEATVTRLRERVEGVRASRAAQPRTRRKPPDDPTGELLSRRRRR